MLLAQLLLRLRIWLVLFELAFERVEHQGDLGHGLLLQGAILLPWHYRRDLSPPLGHRWTWFIGQMYSVEVLRLLSAAHSFTVGQLSALFSALVPLLGVHEVAGATRGLRHRRMEDALPSRCFVIQPAPQAFPHIERLEVERIASVLAASVHLFGLGVHADH